MADERLIARGDRLLSLGDMAGARLFYERAAVRGSSRAATALGKTFDPLEQQRTSVRGNFVDPAKAAEWYRKAIASGGDAEAEGRLKTLEAWLPRQAAK
jgi:TPR repeat protein